MRRGRCQGPPLYGGSLGCYCAPGAVPGPSTIRGIIRMLLCAGGGARAHHYTGDHWDVIVRRGRCQGPQLYGGSLGCYCAPGAVPGPTTIRGIIRMLLCAGGGARAHHYTGDHWDVIVRRGRCQGPQLYGGSLGCYCAPGAVPGPTTIRGIIRMLLCAGGGARAHYLTSIPALKLL